jgi:hypothetical protein
MPDPEVTVPSPASPSSKPEGHIARDRLDGYALVR